MMAGNRRLSATGAAGLQVRQDGIGGNGTLSVEGGYALDIRSTREIPGAKMKNENGCQNIKLLGSWRDRRSGNRDCGSR